tara:strand:- start:2817 stop:5309 length:2493 start_codon:yes stop_codon:yes gene_type:complete
MTQLTLLQLLKKTYRLGSLAVLLIFLWSCQTNNSKFSRLNDWIPQNSSWVIQINDINTLISELTNNEVFREIKSLNPNLTSDISRLLQETPDVKSLICITTVGKNPSVLTHIYKAPIDSTQITGTSIDYSKFKINIEKSEKNILYSTNIQGYTLRSTSQLLIENYIRKFQQKDKKIRQDNLFDKIYTTLDTSAPLNFLVQPQAEELIVEAIGSIPLFPKINHDWNAYDIDFENSGFSLDGLIAVQDSLGDPMGILKENDAQKILLDQLAPENSTSFLSIPLNNALKTEDAFKRWVLHQNIALPQINLKALSNVDEIGWIELGSEIVLLFHSQNEKLAQEYLLPKLENGKNFREISYYPTKLPDDILLFSKVIGSKVKPKWGAVIENFFVFTASEQAIKTVISNHKDGSTLSKNIIYNTFKETLVSQSSIYWIAQTKALIEFWENNKKRKPWSKLDTKRFPFVAFQGTLENSFIHLHFRIHENELKVIQNSVSNQYLLQLEAPLSSPPQWLKNHRTKGMDVLVQDINNKLYLFSDKGNLFWKKQLPGNIQGRIQQVDLYKNKRLQMAFRTEDKFFVLDRNGKIVKPFSIKISSTEPIQPLAVFDYDQRRDYRFVLTRGNNLQMFNSKGKKVSGFKFKKTKTPIINPPVHIRINQKDYIAIQEESGKLSLLNRTGKERVKVKGNIAFSGNSVNSYLKTFTTSDKNGDLIQIDVKGNIVKTNLDLEKGHQIATTTKSLVSQSNNILNIKGIPITLPFGRYTAPKIFYINNIIYVTTTDLDAQKVYLYYSNGTSVKGFPVYGTSAADLTNADKDRALELVVQSESNGIIIYGIN